MSWHRTGDRGFVVIDALMAVVILSLSGTALVTTAVGLLQREISDLDRSVALVTAQSLMRQYTSFGPDTAEESADDLFTYSITEDAFGGSEDLRIVNIEAHLRSSRSAPPAVSLSFLAREPDHD